MELINYNYNYFDLSKQKSRNPNIFNYEQNLNFNPMTKENDNKVTLK